MSRQWRWWVSGAVVLLMMAGFWRWHRPRAELAGLLSHVEEFRLSNGMRWLLVDRGAAPVVTGLVQVKAGGIDELPGRAGVAHMFEHMAFKGSPDIGTKDFAAEQQLLEQIRQVDREFPATGTADEQQAWQVRRAALVQQADALVVPNEVWQLFHEHGAAVINANTGKDATTYFVEMPNTMLRLWTYIASEMVGRPVLRQFYPERDVVMEERRSSVDNSQSGQLYEAMLKTAFTTSPYRTMTIGSMAELSRLTMADAEQFYAAQYHPERMVGVLVGKFDHAQAKADLTRFFGRVKAAGPAAAESFPDEPPQTAERRVTVHFDAEPAVMLAYHKPTLPQRDDYVFDVLAQLLCTGDASRMHRKLRNEQQLVRSIHCGNGAPGARLPNLFLITAQPLGTHTAEEVTAAIEAEVAALRETPVSPDELVHAVTNLRATLLWALNTNVSLAEQLAFFQTMAGDWRYMVTHGDIIATVTPEEIRSAAQRYLQPTQRTIAIATR